MPSAPAIADADAAQRVALGKFDAAFALLVWQAGSGTPSHMTINEVVAQLASLALTDHDHNHELAGARPARAHPNDEGNLGQSSNDVFPNAWRPGCNAR